VPLDEFLPHFHFSERHSTEVAAPPERTLRAVRELRGREVPLTGVLMALRRLPARKLPRPSQGPLLAQMERGGFVLLTERADEVVLGIAGRFWELGSGVRPLSAAEFARFAEPGCARAAIDFRVEQAGSGCRLTTETRIEGTDENARRTFGRYWRVVHPGSALIRREWLRAIRRRAEREDR
jgi:hypothetical protein